MGGLKKAGKQFFSFSLASFEDIRDNIRSLAKKLEPLFLLDYSANRELTTRHTGAVKVAKTSCLRFRCSMPNIQRVIQEKWGIIFCKQL